MSPLEVREIYSCDGSTPHEALAWPLTQKGAITFAGLNANKQCIAMFGTRPTETPRSGVIWFLSSEELKQKPLTVMKMCYETVPQLIEGYDFLHNFVDSRHTQARKWLKLLGFKEQITVTNLTSEKVPFVLMTYEVNK
jgi:hypothetical protein